MAQGCGRGKVDAAQYNLCNMTKINSHTHKHKKDIQITNRKMKEIRENKYEKCYSAIERCLRNRLTSRYPAHLAHATAEASTLPSYPSALYCRKGYLSIVRTEKEQQLLNEYANYLDFILTFMALT